MSKKETVEELSEDIEVVGPGQMLADARREMGLSQDQVAEKLNFRKSLVNDIEQEIFDKSLPATFNRGYLKNYAKLVNASIDEVLASYEMLNVAQMQGAEMQSFSKRTEKQAESNLIMWISYFILALLVAATIMWWYQESKNNSATAITEDTSKVTNTSNSALEQNTTSVSALPKVQVNAQSGAQSTSPLRDEQTVSLSETLKTTPSSQVNTQSANQEQQKQLQTSLQEKELEAIDLAATDTALFNETMKEALEKTEQSIEFTFSGDCWVNIYDATGERIAWGIKKAGYVMTISGQAPFTITLGKPELVSIVYQEQSIDMAQFNRGNVAKFNLPLN